MPEIPAQRAAHLTDPFRVPSFDERAADPPHPQLREVHAAMTAAARSGSALKVVEAADAVFAGYGLAPTLERTQ